MILTNSEIYALYEVLMTLKHNENMLSIKTGFNLLKNLKTLESIYELIADARRKIILSYGEVTPEGTVAVPQEKIQEANQKLEELGTVPNEVSLNLFSLSELENLALSIVDLEKLFPIINGEA